MTARPEGDMAVEALTLAARPDVPNSRLPVMIYRQVFPDGTDRAAGFDALFTRHGWSNGWHDGIFPYTHFHTTAHEVLGIAQGWAEILLGGDHGRNLSVAAGDVIVLPAGTGHRRIGGSGDLLVIGAYAGGRDYDLKRGIDASRDAIHAAIAAVPMPAADPVFGQDGPLVRNWQLRPDDATKTS